MFKVNNKDTGMTLMGSNVSIVDFEVFLVGSSLTNEYNEQKLRILIESMDGAITCPSGIRYCPKKNMKRIKLRNKFLKEHKKKCKIKFATEKLLRLII